MNKFQLTIAGTLVMSALGINSASAFNHEHCSNYAQRAIGQFFEAQQRGFSNLWWPRWGNHRQAHYDFCMAFPALTSAESQARQQRLDSGS